MEQDCSTHLRIFARCASVLSPDAFRIAQFDSWSYESSLVDGEVSLLSRLSDALYGCYMRRSPVGSPPSDPILSLRFMAQLSLANNGEGSWEAGWFAKALEFGLWRVSGGPLDLWVQPHEIRNEDEMPVVRPGAKVAVRIPKEMRFILPGFYLAIGNAPCHRNKQRLTTRIYWNASPESAVGLVRELTTRLNARQIPFRLKVCSDLCAFHRADTSVLYIDRDCYPRVSAEIRATHAALERHLRRNVPYLVKPLDCGLGVAESTITARSFGQYRCDLIARGLYESWKHSKNEEDDRLYAIRSAFFLEGLDPSRPYLESGSDDIYL